jgi:hypothetical protein
MLWSLIGNGSYIREKALAMGAAVANITNTAILLLVGGAHLLRELQKKRQQQEMDCFVP